MTKRLLCAVMALVFAACCLPTAQAAKTSKSTYKSDKALAYAKAHWNDGKGLCAEFVSDCLKAGGVDDVYERRVIDLYNQLKNKGWGTAYKLELTGGTSGRISMSANKDKVKAGDPVFFQCNVCKTFEHVVLCNGADSDGYMKDYAHNNPHDGNKTTYTWRDCGTNNWTVYSIRMDESEPIFGTVTSVPAPKVNYAVNVEQGLHIKWNAIEGATGYRVYRRLPKGSWVYLETVPYACYTDTKAENGKTYIYTVRACKGKVWSAYYAGMEFAFLSQVKFKSTAIDNKNAVKVTWNANPQADGYYLYRQKNSENWERYADLNKSTTTSFVDKDVESGNTYRYRIRVFKGNVVSSYDVAGIKQLYLGTPKMTEMFNGPTGITFNWESVKGSTGYRIYRRGAGEKYWTYLETVKGNSYTDENVKSSNYYRYTVRSASGSVFGCYDPNGKYIRCVATPTLITATSANKKVTLNWSPVEGAAGYYVYHKLAGAKYWTHIATVKNGTSYVDADVRLNSTYQYTVKAFHGYTMSSYDATGLSCKVVDKVATPPTTAVTPETDASTVTSPSTEATSQTSTTLAPVSDSQKADLTPAEALVPTTVAVTEPVTEVFEPTTVVAIYTEE